MRLAPILATLAMVPGMLAGPLRGEDCCCCDLRVGHDVCHKIPFGSGCFCIAVVCPDKLVS